MASEIISSASNFIRLVSLTLLVQCLDNKHSGSFDDFWKLWQKMYYMHPVGYTTFYVVYFFAVTENCFLYIRKITTCEKFEYGGGSYQLNMTHGWWDWTTLHIWSVYPSTILKDGVYHEAEGGGWFILTDFCKPIRSGCEFY